MNYICAASRTSRMVSALERSPLQDGYVSYPWERRLVEMLSIPSSSSFYSILFLPKASDKATARYNDLEDTLARAHAWINASQASGAPIVFMNIQTESLLTKVYLPTYLNTCMQYNHFYLTSYIISFLFRYLETLLLPLSTLDPSPTSQILLTQASMASRTTTG